MNSITRLKPMKKIDILNERKLKPKKKTVQFLLDFSKSIEVLEQAGKNYLVSKN